MYAKGPSVGGHMAFMNVPADYEVDLINFYHSMPSGFYQTFAITRIKRKVIWLTNSNPSLVYQFIDLPYPVS